MAAPPFGKDADSAEWAGAAVMHPFLDTVLMKDVLTIFELIIVEACFKDVKTDGALFGDEVITILNL